MMLLRLVVGVIFCCFIEAKAKLEPLDLQDCAITHGCWAFPPECIDPASCNSILKWQKVGSNKYRFDMQGRDPETDHGGRYIAVGFSDDPWMGNDTVFECVVDGSSGGNVFVSVNVGRVNKRLIGASEMLLTSKDAAVFDGQVICRFEVDLDGIERIESDSERSFEYGPDSLSNKYLLYASGPLSKSGTKLPHPLDAGTSFFPMVTSEKVDLNTLTIVHQMKI